MKCKYCGKRSDTSFCTDRCNKAYDDFTLKTQKYQNIFVISFLCVLLFPPIISIYFLDGVYVFLFSLFFICLVFFIFPFATPQTYDLLSIKGTILLIRCITALLMCLVLMLFITGV